MSVDKDIVTNNQLTAALSGWNIADHLKHKTFDELKAIQKAESLPFAVAAVNLNGGLNIGSMLRTAVVMGAQKFFIIGKRKYDKRACVGANHYIDIEFIEEDINDASAQEIIYQTLMDQNLLPVALETGYEDIMAVDFTSLQPVCLMFGEEATGLPTTFTSRIPHKYSIEQYGVLRSLNVSSAAAMAIFKVAMDLRMPRGWK